MPTIKKPMNKYFIDADVLYFLRIMTKHDCEDNKGRDRQSRWHLYKTLHKVLVAGLAYYGYSVTKKGEV